MAKRLSDIEVDLPETGLGREKLLDFVRLLPSSDVMVVTPMLEKWVTQMRELKIEVQEEWVARIMDDLETQHRIQPETIQGLEPRVEAFVKREKGRLSTKQRVKSRVAKAEHDKRVKG